MNTKSENETNKDAPQARTNPPRADSYDAEVAPSQDASEPREAPERGYGWGV